MPRLSALNLPCLSKDVLDFFTSHGVNTLEEFLTTDIHALPGLLDHTVESEERLTAIAFITKFLSKNPVNPWLSGEEILNSEISPCFYSTGCSSLDSLLHGGFKEGTVTELVGPSASGKSQICMQTAAYVALRNGVGVAYIDSTNSFSAQRVAHIVGQLVGSRERLQEMKGEVSRAMRLLIRMQTFDIYGLLELLSDLTEFCRSAVEEWDFFTRVRVVIVDSPSFLISPVLGGTRSQGHALMIGVGRLLKQLASEFNLAVVVTNHTVSGDLGKPKPALGESWKGVPHVRIMLNREGGSSDGCTAEVIKNSCQTIGGKTRFCITKAGIEGSEMPLQGPDL